VSRDSNGPGSSGRSEVSKLLAPVRGRIRMSVALQALGSALLLSPVITGVELARTLLKDPGDERARTVLMAGSALLAVGIACQGLADLVAGRGADVVYEPDESADHDWQMVSDHVDGALEMLLTDGA